VVLRVILILIIIVIVIITAQNECTRAREIV